MKISFLRSRLGISAFVLMLASILAYIGNVYITKYIATKKADRESAQYTELLSPEECRDQADIAIYKSTYRSLNADHTLSDEQLKQMLALLVGPKKEAAWMRTMFAGMIADACKGHNPSISHWQMVEIAVACKPLLSDPFPALREYGCIFLYRAKLPEAQSDILPLTQDPEKAVRLKALKLLANISKKTDEKRQ